MTVLATGGQDKLAEWPFDRLCGREGSEALPREAVPVSQGPVGLPGCWSVKQQMALIRVQMLCADDHVLIAKEV